MKVIDVPVRPFFYTLDQVAGIMQIPESALGGLVYYPGRSNLVRVAHKMTAINISPPDRKPDWRIEEQEFFRWLKKMGYRRQARG